MKLEKIVLFFILLPLLAAAGNGATDGDFAAANRHFQAGRHGEALQIYLQIEKQLTHWQVFYNIGNCYFKLEQPLAAKIYYLRARKFRPLDRSIAKNIALVNKSFKDAISGGTPDFVSRALQGLEMLLSLNALSILLLAAILLLNVFLFLLLKMGRSRKILYGLVFSLLLSLGLGAYLFQRAAALRQTSVAVVSEDNSILRSGPGESNTELFKINPGLEVKILERNRDWVQVSASAQVAGWIEIKRLTLI